MNVKSYFSGDLKTKIKVCGMGSPQNIREVASLCPDYLGFIFYENSPRNFNDEIPPIPEEIKKTGVFVNTTLEFITEKVLKYGFNAIQLHGDESPEYCKDLRKKLHLSKSSEAVEIIKVFSIKEEFDFSLLKIYEEVVDYFLFDTKGKNKGGNGFTFNWELLKDYPSAIPFFLSGGIGLEEIKSIQHLISFFEKAGKKELLYAVDLNSRFEIYPGKKDIESLKKFTQLLAEH